jgi:hypothetical protein
MQILEAIMANDGIMNQVRITWVDEKRENFRQRTTITNWEKEKDRKIRVK